MADTYSDSYRQGKRDGASSYSAYSYDSRQYQRSGTAQQRNYAAGWDRGREDKEFDERRREERAEQERQERQRQYEIERQRHRQQEEYEAMLAEQEEEESEEDNG